MMKKAIIWICIFVALTILFAVTNHFLVKLESIDMVVTLIFSLVYFIIGSILLYIFNIRKTKKIIWLTNRLEQWNNLSIHVHKAGNEVFAKLPIGILVYDESKTVQWGNVFLETIFEENIVEKQIATLNEVILNNIENKLVKFSINLNDKYYDVTHNLENRILYFFEATDKMLYQKKFENKRSAIGIINLDNLDSETKNFDVHEKISLRGQYLGKISDWATKFNGYLRNYNDDNLFLLIDNDSLEKMILDEFDVLNDIREISKENGVRVTLSIGIASYDASFEELGNLAQTAFDLAEKRGGDQVVLNVQNEKIRYFGTSLNSIEKNTLLKARNKTIEFKEAVENSSEIYIMAHYNTDADAFAALLGTYKMCILSNLKAWIILDEDKIDATTEKLLDLLYSNNENIKQYIINSNDVKPEENALLVVVDTQHPHLVMNKEINDKFNKIAIIDHHRAGEIQFDNLVFTYVEPHASSTIELVNEMMMFYNPKQKLELSQVEASIMLTGIVVDTNNFTYRCNSRTFDTVSRLKENGADMILVRKLLRNDYDLAIKLNKYVNSSTILLDKFAIVEVNDSYLANAEIAQISDALLDFEGVEASFTIATSSSSKTTIISARSFDNVNVQLIMEELGGGGHLNSAATQLEHVSISDAKERLINILKRDYEIGDEQMKIILSEDIKGRGSKNQIIEVATGYGNYLITNKKGVLATPEAIDSLNNLLDLEKQKLADELKMMQKIKADLESKVVNVYIKTGNDGKVFGSITSKQIAEELAAQHGIEIDKRKINLGIDIQSLGIYTVTINLHKDVVANLDVNVLEK